MTTSVNSSAHWGFSGGTRPPYSARPDAVRYRAPVPEILEVERYRVFAEKALHRPITKVWMVDARYGRGGTTPHACGPPWWAALSRRPGAGAS